MIIYESVEAWCERRECKMALRGKSEEKFKLKRIAIGIFETWGAYIWQKNPVGVSKA